MSEGVIGALVVVGVCIVPCVSWFVVINQHKVSLILWMTIRFMPFRVLIM
jgi:hypothetical protein